MFPFPRRGIYKGDLAQVDYFEPSQNQVTLKIIPRIDYTKPRGVIRKALTDQEKKRKRKPGVKLFDQQAIRLVEHFQQICSRKEQQTQRALMRKLCLVFPRVVYTIGQFTLLSHQSKHLTQNTE